MAGEDGKAKEVFRRSALSRVASSDELDRYIKVTNPSAWVITLAALLLVGGVIIWAVVAIVPVTVETTGVMFAADEADGSGVACWVDKATANRIRESGLKAVVDDIEAKTAELSETPMSSSEVIGFLGSDFYKDAIDLEDWNYMVTIELDEVPRHSGFTVKTAAGEAHLVPVSIVVSETRPINIVLGKKQ